MTGEPEAAGCTVTWWGHAAVAVKLDGVHCLTDPLMRRRVGPLHYTGYRPSPAEIAAVDVVLLSHLHRDHTDLPSLARFPATTRLVVPSGGAALLRGRLRATVEELDADGVTTVGPVTVQATFAEHDGRRHFGGPTAIALGYLLSGSRSVYAAGDTDIFPGMRRVSEQAGEGGLDVALLPVSGWGLTLGPGHLNPESAARALTLLRPRLAVPVHWGTLRVPVLWRTRPDRYVTPADDFAVHAAVVAPECRVVIAEPNVPVVVPAQIAS
jgi:L-ascorbate metabolism protein UlaG (beta-lactamase superfamily)